MSKMVKRVLSMLLCAVLLFGAAPLNGFVGLKLPSLSALFAPKAQAADPTSGTCGDNLTWTYDTSTATLTISGTGPMYSYDTAYDYDDMPWKPYSQSIRNLMFNSGITTIGAYAFASCTSLKNVSFSNSIKEISYSAFDGCTSLTSITIPESVTILGSYVFFNCSNLTNITLSDGLMHIGADLLRNTSFYNNSNNWQSDSYGHDCLYIGNHLIKVRKDDYSSESYDIKPGTICIAEKAFQGCGITSISIPDSVMHIGSDAFDNTLLYNNALRWQNGVLYIGSYLIAAKTYLSGNYEIKSDTKCIADGAFGCCENLTGLSIPSSVRSIGSYAFSQCYGLTSVSLPDGLALIDEDTFYGCVGLISVSIPKSIATVGNGAFYYCESLTEINYGGNESDKNAIDFVGNYNSAIINAVWHYCNEFSLIYNANGGTDAPSSQTGETSYTISSTRPTRVGYNFAGWSTSSNAASASYQPGDTITPSGDMTLYAVWSQQSLSSSSSLSTAINYAGQIYWYKFTPSTSGKYVIYSTGDKDTKAFLYNTSGSAVASDDDGETVLISGLFPVLPAEQHIITESSITAAPPRERSLLNSDRFIQFHTMQTAAAAHRLRRKRIMEKP